MKNISITTQFSVFDSIQELPLDVQNLMAEAVAIRKTAYAPTPTLGLAQRSYWTTAKSSWAPTRNAGLSLRTLRRTSGHISLGSHPPEAKILKMAITAASDTNKLPLQFHLAAPVGNR